MKVRDFDNNEYTFPANAHQPLLDDTRPRSELHTRARALLRSLFPTQRILEEVQIPGLNLYCDFYLPSQKTIVEVHGIQHFEFIPHFHGDKQGRSSSMRRDQRKLDWAALNNIKVIILPYDEDDKKWTMRINGGVI